MDEQVKEYWSRFYASLHTTIPSPFAASVAMELNGPSEVVDMGCGNGRDTMFFASLGHRVLGLDVATTAIANNRRASRERGLNGVGFEELDVGLDGNLEAALGQFRSRDRNESVAPLAIYARFFLHAITKQEQDTVTSALANYLGSGDRCFFEFRTDKDRSLHKRFGSHYRRFISLDALVASVERSGAFACIYRVEGRGMAKYKEEDPIVGRVYLRRV